MNGMTHLLALFCHFEFFKIDIIQGIRKKMLQICCKYVIFVEKQFVHKTFLYKVVFKDFMAS